MLELESELLDDLKSRQVRIEVPDADTVFFRNVPADERIFNKPRTNLLVKRPAEGMPFLAFVDEDLEYRGADRMLARAFAAGRKKQGWRMLFPAEKPQTDLQNAVENALRILGYDGCEPALYPYAPSAVIANGRSLFAGFGADLSEQAREGNAETTIGRTEEIEDVVSCLLGRQSRMPVIAGESGVGKTNLLHGIALKLCKLRPEFKIFSIDLNSLMAGTTFEAERENLLSALLKEMEAAPNVIAAMEHLEIILSETVRGPLLIAQALEKGVRLIGTIMPNYLSEFECEPLSRRIHIAELTELTAEESVEAVLAIKDQISTHHKVAIDDSLIRAVIESAKSIKGRFPAKAIVLLDAAATRAVLSGATEVNLYEIYLAAAKFQENDERKS